MQKISIIKRITAPLPELENYYRERRKERFENNKLIGGKNMRRILHPLLLGGLKIKHLLCGQKIKVIGDNMTTKNGRIIFAATHIGWDDVEMVLTAIQSHAYVLWGDPRESYKTIDGCLLDMNGAFICDTDNKWDRFIAKESCVRWLNQGGKLLVFPEGVWNFSENKLVMYLFNGVSEMAIRTGASIVPVAIVQFEQEYRVNFGENIDGSKWRLEQKQELTGYLRDAMATLKWELYETQPVTERKSIPDNVSELYKQFLLKQAKGIYSWEEFAAAAYRPAGITSPQEAFACVERLQSRGQAYKRL